jgi:hypothetical protein
MTVEGAIVSCRNVSEAHPMPLRYEWRERQEVDDIWGVNIWWVIRLLATRVVEFLVCSLGYRGVGDIYMNRGSWVGEIRKWTDIPLQSQHIGNSCVLVGWEDGVVAAPAHIEHIIQLPALEEISSFIGIWWYKCIILSEDPFLSFPILQTQIWSVQLGNLEIILVGHICVYFTNLSVKWEDTEIIIVSSMSHVGYSTPWNHCLSDLDWQEC